MNRTPIESGRNRVSARTPPTRRPPGADRWTAFRRTDLMPAMGLRPDGYASQRATSRMAARRRRGPSIGGWNILTDAFIAPSTSSRRKHSEGAIDRASRAWRAPPALPSSWDTLADRDRDRAARGVDVRLLHARQGLATGSRLSSASRPSSAIDPAVIAAQERRLTLQSLLSHPRPAGGLAAARSRTITAKPGAVEFESLAVLDRRIAECRARIAWFEQAAEGNDLPGAAWAGLTGRTARTTDS